MRISRRGGRWRLLLVVGLLHFPTVVSARAETRHVLVLSSSERPFAPQTGFTDALMRDLIRESREPIQFVEVPIQAARASAQAPDVSTAQRIRSAFGGARLDLIITIGGPAAAFAQQFRRDLFPETPTLIAGVDRRFVEKATFTANETTVTTEHDPAMIIDEILRLLPETRAVTVIVGTSQVEQFWLQQMKREFRRFDGRLQFTYTNELGFKDILKRCGTMPAQSAIFFAILALDGKGEPRPSGDLLTTLHAVANAPLFALQGVGRGIVGGPMLSTDDLSRTTTRVALRVLAGESPGSITTPTQRSGTPTYDARELRRWNIDESRLRPASVVLYREPGTWQSPVALGALLGGIPVVVAFLLVGVVQRRRARRDGAKANGVLALVPADGAVRVWTAGADGTRVAAGSAADAAARDEWTSVMHPEDLERCREIYRRALEQREPFQMEYRVREADGVERWILDTGLPKFAGQDFDGYVGSAVDITRLRRTRAELSNLSRHLLQTHEQERAALAKALHEDVCQRMVELTLRLHNIQGAPSDGEIADIKDKLAGLVGEIASMSDPVHQRLERMGLAAAAAGFCESLSRQHGVTVRFEDRGVPRQLPSDRALALFRVLQEATVNAIVHSGAREVCVMMRGTASEVRLQIVDRGLGFDAQRPVPTDGVGLVAIRERLMLVKGGCEIVSRPGEGTSVEAWVPVRGDA